MARVSCWAMDRELPAVRGRQATGTRGSTPMRRRRRQGPACCVQVCRVNLCRCAGVWHLVGPGHVPGGVLPSGYTEPCLQGQS